MVDGAGYKVAVYSPWKEARAAHCS